MSTVLRACDMEKDMKMKSYENEILGDTSPSTHRRALRVYSRPLLIHLLDQAMADVEIAPEKKARQTARRRQERIEEEIERRKTLSRTQAVREERDRVDQFIRYARDFLRNRNHYRAQKEGAV